MTDVLSTVIKPAVSVPVAFVLLSVGASAIRNLRFAWLAWSPGLVDVRDFAAPANGASVDSASLTAQFRTRLSRLSLQTPNPIPGAPREGTFLDALSQSSLDLRDPTVLVRLARAALPTHAYQVQGTLRIRSHGNDVYGVIAQVVRLPRESSTSIEVWASSWEEAVRRAADDATAAILPQTRRCARQWVSWRGYVMPPGLLPAYEEGLDYETAGKPELALRRYYDALGRDPFNLAIRLEIGQLQERADMALEAFATYQGIVTVTLPAGRPLPPRLYSRRVKRERRRTIAIARHRRAIVLAGEAMASQWLAAEQPYRDALEPIITGLLNEHGGVILPPPKGRARTLIGDARPGSAWLSGLLEDRLGPDVSDHLLPVLQPAPGVRAKKLERQYRLLFGALGLAITHELATSKRFAIQLTGDRLSAGFRRQAPALTRKPIVLSRDCMRLRVARARHELGEANVWRDSLDGITANLDDALGHWIFGLRIRQWHEGYNTACVYAIPLLYPLDRARREMFAETAVLWLERATACADSGYVASRRHWLLDDGADQLLQGDPDLTELRRSKQFKLWRAVYFPER